jgi:sugar/nucleoside kinase (ribokinase family)
MHFLCTYVFLPFSLCINLCIKDLNGVDDSDASRNKHEAVLGAAFADIDVLHANAEEAEAISGIKSDPLAAAQW